VSRNVLSSQVCGCVTGLWYDDVVASLYRASELLAQTYIQLELGLASGDRVDKTGVSGLYRWLQAHEAVRGKGNDEHGLGSLYGRQRRHLRRLFEARKVSLLGHGLPPIEQGEWQALQSRVANLLAAMLNEPGLAVLTAGPTSGAAGAAASPVPSSTWREPLMNQMQHRISTSQAGLAYPDKRAIRNQVL
jgi:hypothetical protein